MSIPLALLLTGFVLIWIGYPFWRGRVEGVAGAEDGLLQDLLFQKEALLATTRELDFDLQTDKLSPEDHQAFRNRNKIEAVGIMQRLEKFTPSGGGSSPNAEASFCPSCGRKHEPSDRYCAGCGNRLSHEANKPK